MENMIQSKELWLMYEYGGGGSDSEKRSSSESRYSGPFYQDNIGSSSSRSTIGEVKVKEKKKSFPRLMMKVICVALVFGIVALSLIHI